MSARTLLIVCVSLVLAACSTPAPETPTATAVTPERPTPTPSPVPPTDTPSPTPEPTATPIPKLSVVLARGAVRCGIDPARPDFDAGQVNFDLDLCRALAAALFDNPDAYTAVQLDSRAAVAALGADKIDIYIGAADQIPSDTFAGPTMFIDAAGALARIDVGIRQISDLKFATVCLIQDSIDERRFMEEAAASRVAVQPFLFNASDRDAMYNAYDEGRCDAVVDDRIRLALRRPALSVPRDHALIDLALIKSKRGMLAAASDANWAAVVDAASSVLIWGEQLSVTSASLEAALLSEDAALRRLLGGEGNIGAQLGLSNDFAARIIRRVGNYAEMYERHYDGLPRGPNALVKDGGMIAVEP